jgi:hypothetical protein
MALKPLTPALNSPATPPRRSPDPYKRRAPHPEFTTPLPATLRISPCSSLPLTDRRHHRAFTIVARPPRHRSSPSEALDELPVRSSLCCTPAGELWRTGAAGGRAPVSAPPCPGPSSVCTVVGPRWTECARPVHRDVDPVHGFLRWKIIPGRKLLDILQRSPSVFPKLTRGP